MLRLLCSHLSFGHPGVLGGVTQVSPPKSPLHLHLLTPCQTSLAFGFSLLRSPLSSSPHPLPAREQDTKEQQTENIAFGTSFVKKKKKKNLKMLHCKWIHTSPIPAGSPSPPASLRSVPAHRHTPCFGNIAAPTYHLPLVN